MDDGRRRQRRQDRPPQAPRESPSPRGPPCRAQRQPTRTTTRPPRGSCSSPTSRPGLLAEGGPVPAPGARGRSPATRRAGIAAWLQRTMGLRIREALGAEKRDFRTRKDGSHYLRLRSQATRDGKGRAPLKHRKEGQGRDIPVPDFIWNMVAAMPDGPLCPGPQGTPYLPYYTAADRFAALTTAMGITGYTTHSLRHQFASEALDRERTSRTSRPSWNTDRRDHAGIYVHPTEDAEARMRDMMNDRWGTARPQQQGSLAPAKQYTGQGNTEPLASTSRPAARPRPPGPRRQRPAPRPPRQAPRHRPQASTGPRRAEIRR